MQMVVLALWRGVISRSLHGRFYVKFGPFVTTEAHLAFSGARTHSNNTAEVTAMIETFSFLGFRGPVTHNEQSRISCDSMHAAGFFFGSTVQARTHVQVAFACPQSLIRVQHKLRLTTEQRKYRSQAGERA